MGLTHDWPALCNFGVLHGVGGVATGKPSGWPWGWWRLLAGGGSSAFAGVATKHHVDTYPKSMHASDGMFGFQIWIQLGATCQPSREIPPRWPLLRGSGICIP